MARRWASVWSWSSAILLALGWVLMLVTPVRAAGGCVYTIDGQDLDAADSPDHAIAIPSNAVVDTTVTAPGPLGQVTIGVQFWPVTVPVQQPPPTEASTWSGQIDLAAQGTVVQGLYQITISLDPPQCPPTTGWVRISGDSPLLTVPGVVGTAVAAGGGAVLIGAVRGAQQGRAAAARGAVGGALAGLGALVVAQQAGEVPLDARSIVVWTGLPGVAGSTVTQLVSRRRRSAPSSGGETATRGRPADGGAEPPKPAPPPPSAPPTAAEPPSPVLAEPPPAYAEPPLSHAEPPPAYAEPPPAAAQAPATAAEPPPAAGPIAGAEPPPALDEAAPEEAAANGGGAGAAAPEPPRVSYAHLEAPDAVVAVTPFDLSVGLASAPDADVDAAPLIVPSWSHGDYVLTVQLLADGFEPVDPGPDPWRIDLPVTGEKPYPIETFHLRAVAIDGPVRGRQIRATYSIEGQVMGVATRQIAVVDNEARLAALAPVEPKPPATLSTPRGEVAPDLTITIEHQEDESGGSFWLQMLTRNDVGVRPDSNALPIDLGSGAQAFLQGVIASVHANEGKASMGPSLLGIGHQIAKQLPNQFWSVLGEVSAAVAPQPPSIQILSAEAHIPWELAVFPNDVALVDPQAPRFLGAQVNIGRWVIGEPPPRVPPPATLNVHTFAVISGVFTGPSALEQADAEADALESTFEADPIQAVDEAVLACLGHKPAYDVIHFAVHGSYTDQGAGGDIHPQILLADGTFLDENAVIGLEPLPGTPLVFMNACQVGSGHQVLGDYAGMAAAFLYAGAAAVVAPLWSIDDTAAKDIGLRFYERVFAGASPAEALRLERASFLKTPETASSTFLAYQYYGHPSLKLERDQP